MTSDTTNIRSFVLLEQAHALLIDNCKWSNTHLRESLIQEIHKCLYPTVDSTTPTDVLISPAYRDVTIGSKWWCNDGRRNIVVTVSHISGGIVTVAKFDGLGGTMSCNILYWFNYYTPFNDHSESDNG